MKRKPPPKARHQERPPQPPKPSGTPPDDDRDRYSAPSHMGGQFDDAGYGFGFKPRLSGD